MERIHRATRKARRRRLVADGLDRLGLALSIACAIGLLAVIVSRLIGEPLDWWWAVVPPVSIGALFSLVIAWRRRLTDLQAATDVDTTLRLRDRLGSSIELETLDREDPFVQLLERDAEEAADKIDIRQATPIQLGNAWLTWPTLAALLVVAVMFMPTFDLLGRRRAALDRAQQEARVQDAADTLEDLIEQSDDQLADLEPSPEGEDDLSDLLEDIQQQLEQGELTPEEAMAQAAAAMDEKSKELQEQADQAQQATDMIEQMLAESADPDNADASEFEQALDSGDFKSAAEALSEMQSALDEMTPAQRQAMAESMSEMADRLSEAANNKQAQDNAQQRLSQQLQQMGLSKEQAEQLANNGDAQQIAEQLEQQGVSAEDAQKLAEQMAQQRAQGDTRTGAIRSAQKLAEALKQAGKGATSGDPSDMQALGEALEGLSDAELEGELAALAAGQMSGDAGVGGTRAGEGTGFNEQFPMGMGKSLTEDVENRKGEGKGEVAMRYTRDRPVEWDEGASSAPMREARIREAAKAAEQAIEEQAISPRYRGAIREYFERGRKTAPPAQTEPDQSKPDQSKSGQSGTDQTGPDQTKPDPDTKPSDQESK